MTGSSEKRSQRTVERSREKRLRPGLCAWLDGIIVPALVREYVETVERKNTLANGREVVAESAAKSKVTVEED